MKRNKDYIYYILKEIEDDYSDEVTFKRTFQKWLDVEPRSKDECKEFILSNDLLLAEGFVSARNLTVEGSARVGVQCITWKGYDLLEQLRGQ